MYILNLQHTNIFIFYLRIVSTNYTVELFEFFILIFQHFKIIICNILINIYKSNYLKLIN